MTTFTQLLTAAAMFLTLASPQAPTSSPRFPPPSPPKPPPKIRPTLTTGAKKEVARLREELQGVWRLDELWDPRMRPSERMTEAYVLVQDDYLSMEVHIDWLDQRKLVGARLFDSGIYHYELLGNGMIEMRSVISAVLDPGMPGMQLQFRYKGFVRQYKIELTGERMVWTREDGQRSEFTRLEGTGVRRDIFGRKLPPKEEGGQGEDAEDGAAPGATAPKAPGTGDAPR